MSKRIAAVVVVLAVVVAAGWWWKARTRPARRAEPAAAAHGDSGVSGGGGLGGAGTAAARARLEGRVRGPGGGAVAGAVVHLAPEDDDDDDGDREPQTVATDPGGNFVLTDLAPGTYTVAATAPGHVPAIQQELSLRGGATERIELTLAAGGITVRGTVTDASGGAIAGATVAASEVRDFLDTSAAGATLSDSEGRYAMNLAPGSYRVRATHPEYVGAGAHLELRDAELVQDFRLVPGGVIEGVVKDELSGEPVAAANVYVERDSGRGGWAEGRTTVLVRSDGRGGFRAAGLVPGNLSIRAEVTDDGRVTREPVRVALGVAEQASNVEVFVGAAPYVAGKVIDDQGVAVPHAYVTAYTGGSSRGMNADAAGNFRVVGLAPGKWKLIGSGERHQATEPLPIVVSDVPLTGVVVKVTAAPHITGRVEPAGVAEISLERQAEAFDAWGEGGAMGTMAAMTSATSGDDGRFDLSPVERGTRTVVAKAADGRRGSVTVEVPAQGAVDVVIALKEAGSIAGRVVDQHGAPATGMVVHVKKTEANRRATMVVNGVDVTTDRAAVARDGSFVMRGLDAGRYELTAADDRGGRLGWAGGKGKAKGRAPVVVQLAADEQKRGIELAVEIDDGVIRGVVKNPDGTPRVDAWVTASLRHDELMPEPAGESAPNSMSTTIMIIDDGNGVGGTPPTLTDDQGRFELRGLRRGNYDVVAEADRGALRGRVERVQTGSDVTIALAGLATLTGTVTQDGKPVIDFTVSLEGQSERTQTVKSVGGRFTIARIDPGAYLVRVRTPGAAGKASVTALAGKTSEVTIAIAGAAKVRGRLVDAAGAPVADRPVMAMPQRAEGEHGSFSFEGQPPMSDADGRFELELDAGSYHLIFLGGGVALPPTPFTVTSGQQLDLGDLKP